VTAGDLANCWIVGGHRSCERIEPSANLAAKRQQKLAQGVSPGFDFRSDTSREAAADAANLTPLRGSDMDKHEPQRARWAIFSRRFAAWATRPDAPGYLSVAASRRNNSFTPHIPPLQCRLRRMS